MRESGPSVKRVPAWTVAAPAWPPPDYVRVVKDPDTGLVLSYEEAARRWYEPLPTILVHRLTAVQVATCAPTR